MDNVELKVPVGDGGVHLTLYANRPYDELHLEVSCFGLPAPINVYGDIIGIRSKYIGDEMVIAELMVPECNIAAVEAQMVHCVGQAELHPETDDVPARLLLTNPADLVVFAGIMCRTWPVDNRF